MDGAVGAAGPPDTVSQLFDDAKTHLDLVRPPSAVVELAHWFLGLATEQADPGAVHDALAMVLAAGLQLTLRLRAAAAKVPTDLWEELRIKTAAITDELETECRARDASRAAEDEQLSPRAAGGSLGRPDGMGAHPRMADGLDHPARLDAAYDFAPDPSDSTLTVNESLLALAPEFVERSYLLDLLDDFHRDMAARHPPAALTEEELLAVYAYTYEIKEKGSARRRFRGLEADALYAEVRAILYQERWAMSGNGYDTLQGAGVTAVQILGEGALDPPALRTLSLADRLAVKKLRAFLGRPENDDSHPFQIYRAMNAGMRAAVVHPDGFAPFRTLIHRLQAALAKLPLVHGRTLYRGVGIPISPALYQPGSNVLWQSFSSTSRSIGVSTAFCRSAPEAPAALFVIRTVAAYDVMALSRIPPEAELLLPPNTGLRVEGLASQSMRDALGLPDRVQVIELRQLPPWQVDAECRLEQGAALIGTGSRDDGLAKWRGVMERYPGTAPSLFAEASVRMWTTPPDLIGARAVICEALAIDPLSPGCHNRYAQVLHGLRDDDGARLMYRRALAISPGHYGTLGNYFVFLYTISSYGACRALAPDFCRSRLWAARLDVRRGDPRSAEANAHLALCSQPLNAEALSEYQRLLLLNGKADRCAHLEAVGLRAFLEEDAAASTDRIVRFWHDVWARAQSEVSDGPDPPPQTGT